MNINLVQDINWDYSRQMVKYCHPTYKENGSPAPPFISSLVPLSKDSLQCFAVSSRIYLTSIFLHDMFILLFHDFKNYFK